MIIKDFRLKWLSDEMTNNDARVKWVRNIAKITIELDYGFARRKFSRFTPTKQLWKKDCAVMLQVSKNLVLRMKTNHVKRSFLIVIFVNLTNLENRQEINKIENFAPWLKGLFAFPLLSNSVKRDFARHPVTFFFGNENFFDSNRKQRKIAGDLIKSIKSA